MIIIDTNQFLEPQASSTPLKPNVATIPAVNTALPPMSATTTPIKSQTPAPKKEEKEDISAEVAAVNKMSEEIKDKWGSIVSLFFVRTS